MQRLLSYALPICLLSAPVRAQTDVDDTVQRWLQRLSFKARPYREKGIRELADLAAQSRAVSVCLIGCLSAPDWTTRRNAAEALGRIRPDITGAVPALSRALGDERPEVVLQAMASLEKLETAAREALPELEWLLVHPSPEMREQAIRTLAQVVSHLGSEAADYLPSLRRGLDDPDRWVRRTTLRALADLGDARVAPILGAELVAASGTDREAPAEMLQTMGPSGSASVPYLVKALRGGAPDRLVSVIRAVGAIGPAAKDAAPELCDLLDDPRFGVESAMALARIGTGAREAVPALLDSLERIETQALRATFKLGGANTWTPRARAIASLRALAAFGADVEAAGAILPFLRARDGIVRIAAAEVIARSGLQEPGAWRVLLAGLDSRDSNQRRAAAEAIGRLAPAGQQAIPALIDELSDESEDVSHDAIAFFPLHELVPSRTCLTRDAAATALGKFGALAHAAIPQLVIALEDRQVRVRLAAIVALGQIGAATPEGITKLVEIGSGRARNDARSPLIPAEKPWWDTEAKDLAAEREAALATLRQLGARAR